MKKFLKFSYYLIPIFLVVLLVSIADTSMSKSNQAQTRPPLIDLWGVTLQNVTDDDTPDALMDSISKSLSLLGCDRTTRIVYNPDEDLPFTPNPGWYDGVTSEIKNVSKVMGLFLDSDSWEENYWNNLRLTRRLDSFMRNSSLFDDVDIWEIGNEANGTWLSNGEYAEVQFNLDSLFRQAKYYIDDQDGTQQTALTLYFYPSIECVEDENPPYDADNYMMLKWATDFVTNYPDAVNNIDYVFISYYKMAFDECYSTNEGWYWQTQVDSLKNLFPNSLVGFGEIGWIDDPIYYQEPTDSQKIAIINTYYPWAPSNVPIYYPWIHAGFYWNYGEDCFDANYSFSNNPIWKAIDSIMGVCNNDGDRFGKNFKTNSESNLSNFCYSLKNNYPNPFNPSTKISFEIPKQEFVSLKIYDLLGREIKTLVNEVKSPGSYTVDFNASDLSSGIYFYKLQTKDFVSVKRMMLIK